MTGSLAALTTVSEGIIAAVVLAAWAIGITDVVRLPGWAWRRAGKSKALWVVVIVILAPVGLLLYVFLARPPVAALAEQGRAAVLPLDGLDATPRRAASPAAGTGGAAIPPGERHLGAASPPHTQVRQQPITVTQEFRPSPPAEPANGERLEPTAPAGWKDDPTGRHQFRYWDGFRWTDSVADAGVQSNDPLPG